MSYNVDMDKVSAVDHDEASNAVLADECILQCMHHTVVCTTVNREVFVHENIHELIFVGAWNPRKYFNTKFFVTVNVTIVYILCLQVQHSTDLSRQK